MAFSLWGFYIQTSELASDINKKKSSQAKQWCRSGVDKNVQNVQSPISNLCLSRKRHGDNVFLLRVNYARPSLSRDEINIGELCVVFFFCGGFWATAAERTSVMKMTAVDVHISYEHFNVTVLRRPLARHIPVSAYAGEDIYIFLEG